MPLNVKVYFFGLLEHKSRKLSYGDMPRSIGAA